MTNYDWTPMTEEERWRNAGLGAVLDAAALGDPLAALLARRIQAAFTAMEPDVERIKAEIEREWMEGSASGGLGLLVGDPEATSTIPTR